jgi:hypothetical protein
VVAYVINLLYDPNTYISYYPFSLCLSTPPSAAALRTLVIIWLTAAVGIHAFPKKEKEGSRFVDVKW